MSELTTLDGSVQFVELGTGYDAATATKKRTPPTTEKRREEKILTQYKRDITHGASNDLHRNFALVAWAIRRHLDYVATWSFQARTESPELNEHLEQLMREWSRPQNCDAAGRHTFGEMIRLAEARRTLDGDVFLMKRNTGRLNAIESDKIRNPDKSIDGEVWYNGVLVNSDGRARAYGLYDRSDAAPGFVFNRRVSAANMLQHAHWTRFDQVRGVSPMLSAVNSFRDVYEGIDFALAKMKVEQLFAFLITSADPGDEHTHSKGGDFYTANVGQGPIKLELEPGDDGKFLKSDSPGTAVQEFLKAVVAIALKSLDIPYNFFDESSTNFFGSRASWLLYDRACKAKRASVVELLRRITVWQFQMWVLQGKLILPEGMTVADIDFEWVSLGMPWWDPVKELTGDRMAVASGLDNPYRIAKERGRGEFEHNIDQTAKAMEYAASKGVPLDFGSAPGSAHTVAEIADEMMPEDGAEMVPDTEPEADADPAVDVKTTMDAYGAGVRAGAITPTLDDENHFRSMAGLPPITAEIAEAWAAEGGTRRPVTLAAAQTELDSMEDGSSDTEPAQDMPEDTEEDETDATE